MHEAAAMQGIVRIILHHMQQAGASRVINVQLALRAEKLRSRSVIETFVMLVPLMSLLRKEKYVFWNTGAHRRIGRC
jgi:Zn finger protein HypA/HybF involved in hydrogenase expression